MSANSTPPSPEELLAHAGWLQALARRLCGDSPDADDMVQNAWVAALTHPPPRSGATRAWLAAVLGNFERQRARHEGARVWRERRAARNEELPSTDELLEWMEQQRLLVDLVTELSEPVRRAVILRYYEGLSSAEIARRVGEKAGTIRQRLKRGLDALRNKLDERYGDRERWLGALAPLASFEPLAAETTIGSGLGGALVLNVSAVVVLALVVGFVLWPFDPDDSAADSAVVVLEDEASSGNRADDPRREADRTEESGRTPSTDRMLALSQRDASTRNRRRIEGRVRAPEEYYELDETLEVLVLRNATSYAEFVNEAPEWERGDRPLARAHVTDHGSFEIHVPEGMDRVHLMLRGRYLYLEHSIAVSAGPATAPITLDARLGAWIRGQLASPERKPADIPVHLWTDDLAAVVGGESPSGFAPTQLTTRSGAFEFRAVPASATCFLLTLPPRHAAKRIDLGPLSPGERRDFHLPLLQGGTVCGRVFDPAGVPLPGAEVVAALRGSFLGFDDRPVRRSVAGANGIFTIEHLPPGTVDIRARHPEHLESKRVEVTVVEGRKSEWARLELADGRSLAGRVSHENGEPAKGAIVEVTFDEAFYYGPSAFNALRGATGEARCDEQGRFCVRGLGAGPFVMAASLEPGAAGRAESARLDGVPGGSVGLELVLTPPSSLSGRVETADGDTPTSFVVHAVRVSRGAFGETASVERSCEFSSPDGGFRLDGLIDGRWRVVAGGANLAWSAARIIELPGGELVQPFVVNEPATVTGTVESPTGAQVAGAFVRVDRALPSWQRRRFGGPDPASATTDEAGRFRLEGLSPGPLALCAVREGYARSPAMVLELTPGEERGGVRLVLARGGRITGEVHEGNRPAAGHIVYCLSWKKAAFESALTRTDEFGAFQFDHVRPGSWQILALDPDGDWSADHDGEALVNHLSSIESVHVTVEDGTDHHLVIGSTPGETIRVYGRITHGGEVHEDEVVGWLPFSGPFDAPGTGTRRSMDGAYETTLPGAGRYIVSLDRMTGMLGEGSTILLPCDIPDADESHLDLILPGGGIEGRIHGPDGRAAVRVPVMLMTSRSASVDLHLAPRFAETMTDDEGRYRFDGSEPGRYVIRAGGDGFGRNPADPCLARIEREIVLKGSDAWERGIDFELPDSGRIEVTVVDQSDSPVHAAVVLVRDAAGEILEPYPTFESDARGLVLCTGLARGEYTVLARTDELASVESAPLRVEVGEPAAVTLRVQPGTFLRVRTVDDDGRCLGSMLSVLDGRGREYGGSYALGACVTDRQRAAAMGQHLVGPLLPGRYRLRARGSGGRTHVRELELTGAGEDQISLPLTH